jgi:hypothetical protein
MEHEGHEEPRRTQWEGIKDRSNCLYSPSCTSCLLCVLCDPLLGELEHEGHEEPRRAQWEEFK